MFKKIMDFFRKIGVLKTGKAAAQDLEINTNIDND